MFLDEPTAGLDAAARILVWELIDRLRADGVCVLLTTHLMDEAEQLADDLVIIDRGRVVAHGTPSEVTSRGAENELRFKAPRGLDLDLLRSILAEEYSTEEISPGTYLVAVPSPPR